MKKIQVEMSPGYNEEDLKKSLSRHWSKGPFVYRIEKKSLDARRKGRIRWVLSVSLFPPNRDISRRLTDGLVIPPVRTGIPAVVVGSGPAGIFSAIVLQKSGFRVTLVERGSAIDQRQLAINHFEATGEFSSRGNYSFGEGGAGAFSDGKLTSRTKGIGPERDFIHGCYIQGGAPEEIAYLSHPHVGSDILFNVTASLRSFFLELGGEMLFNTQFIRPVVKQGVVTGAECNSGVLDCSVLIVAAGHSALETLRNLIQGGVPFQPKRMAVGHRAEHPQSIINQAQWGCDSLPGIKAAEYRLKAPDQVYTFCMCPGGRVIPAAPYGDVNIVNGMSLFARDGLFANAAVVAQFHPGEILGDGVSASRVLDWLEGLERAAYNLSGASYSAPAVSIGNYINGRTGALPEATSYCFPLLDVSPAELIPEFLGERIRAGLEFFCRKLKGYDQGILMGLESKTSSPVQVLREDDRSVTGFSGLYVAGEMSGWSGGIISSGVDGIKAALSAISSSLPH